MTTTKTREIFISYARKDGRDLALRLKQDLAEAGHSVWLDTSNIDGGASWSRMIEDEIDACDITLALLSQGSYESDICRGEQLRALRKGKRVIPLRIQIGAERPLPLEHLNYLDFSDNSQYRDVFQKLLEDIGSGKFIPLPEEFRYTVTNAPILPDHFVGRQYELERLRQAVLSDNTERRVALTALQGLGGIGKSVLAAALCHDDAVKDAFPDGVIWVEIGRSPEHLVDQMQLIGTKLGDDPRFYTSFQASKDRLHTILPGKSALIVLDDVWYSDHIDPFIVDAPLCRILYTTRDRNISDTLRFKTQEIQVDVLKPHQAVELLKLQTGRDDPAYEDIAEQLGCLPLALELVGARLRNGMPASQWLQNFKNLSQISLERGDPEGRHTSLKNCFELSVNAVEPNQYLYHTLGIFPEDVWVPENIVMQLWCEIQSDTDCYELMDSLADLALIKLHKENRTVLLHDLLHVYTEEQLGGERRNTHRTLLKAFGFEPASPWEKIAFNPYFYKYLHYHLDGTEYHLEENPEHAEVVFKMLATAHQWLEIQFDEHETYPLAEQLVVNICRLCHKSDADKTHGILKRWLKTGKPVTTQGPSRLLAVRCGFEVEDIELLILALRDKEKHVQDSAVRYVFYLSNKNPQKGLAVVEGASRYVRRLGVLPDVDTISVMIPLILALLVSHQKHMSQVGEDELLIELGRILQDTLRRVAYAGGYGPIRLLGNGMRSMLIKGMKMYVRRMLNRSDETAKTGSSLELDESQIIDSNMRLDEFAFHFQLDPQSRAVTRKLIPYINHTRDSILDIKEQIYFVYSTWDFLGAALANLVLGSWAGRAIDDVFVIFEYTFEQLKLNHADDHNLLASAAEAMAHNFSIALDFQSHIKDEWLLLLKEMVQYHIKEAPYGYGMTKTLAEHLCRYYSLMYYGAVWNKKYPEREIDLVQEYLGEAEKEEDKDKRKKLILFVIRSLGERGTEPQDYRGILKSLTPYVKDPDREIRKTLIEALAVIWNKQPGRVEGFLVEAQADQDLLDIVKEQGFNEPITELTRRFGDFVDAFLIGANEVTLQQVVDSVERAFDSASVDDALEVGLKEVLNRLMGESVFI